MYAVKLTLRQVMYCCNNLRYKLTNKPLHNAAYLVKTFHGTKWVNYEIILINLRFNGAVVTVEALVDAEFNINYSSPGVNTMIETIKSLNQVKFAD